MIDSLDGIPNKQVLDLFANEAEFRDFLVANLDLIEPGLEFLEKEHVILNPNGSGGRVDILARDPYGHILCIEIKRSDSSARSTLNELSKYVALLVDRDQLPQHNIRCVVVSTHWNELLLPLSYFAHFVNVQVTALQAVRDGDQVLLQPLTMTDIKFLPQLSPDMDLIWFEAEEPRLRYVDFLKARSARLPFVRLALLLFQLRPEASKSLDPFSMMICVWRIKDGLHDKIEEVIGKPIGQDWPYAARGWEPEADAKNWIDDAPFTDFPEVAKGWTHGTPEKLSSLLPNYGLQEVVRLGGWPKNDLINDDKRILEMAQAMSPLFGAGRPSRHRFHATVTPRIVPSWQTATASFLDFISFEELWKAQAAAYLDQIVESDVSVELHAWDKKHLVYAIHQARFHEEAMYSFFQIAISRNGTLLRAMRGMYVWDGVTRPPSASELIHTVYGGIMHARVAIGSAVDDARYEPANRLHGFFSAFDWLDEYGSVRSTPSIARYSLRDFVASNPDYSAAISETLEQVGALPTDPSS